MPRFKAQLKSGNFSAHVSLLYGDNPQEAEADLERKMGEQSLFSVTIEEDPTDYFAVVLMARVQSGDYFPEDYFGPFHSREDAEAWTQRPENALGEGDQKHRYDILLLGS